MHDDRGIPPPSREPRAHPPLIELVPGAGESWEQARPRPVRQRYVLAVVLFLATLFCSTTVGAVWSIWIRTDQVTGLPPWVGPETVRQVWTDPALLGLGLSFSIPALFILLCHELGHYLACRYYRLPSTLPYFLPFPAVFGTLGAFIKIKAPIRSKKELFDVGIAGPLAGFVALVPFLLYGVAHSSPAPMPPQPPPGDPGAFLLLPGQSLLLQAATRLLHGPLPAGTLLNLHPTALAAWFGLFATALNLLPLGQLDGGHILYATVGRVQRRLALPLWAALGLVGLYWPGWLLWCLIVLLMGLSHPPVADESGPLSPGRRRLAWVALGVLVLSFVPVPVRQVAVPAGPPPGAVQAELPQGVGSYTSRTKVTGPSLTSSTSIRAPNRPVATASPCARMAATSDSTNGSASCDAAAPSKDGRRPRASEPARVNWETTRKAPPTAAASRFMRPDSSSKIRSPASLAAAAATCSGPSPRSTPTRSSMPRPISPTAEPSTRTAAELTRCKTRRMLSVSWR